MSSSHETGSCKQAPNPSVERSVVPEVTAEIHLLTTAEGGRQGPILQGEYRGVIGVGEENFSVRFFVPMTGGFVLGETQKIGMQFLFPEAALSQLSVGTKFTVWEGGIIGHGTVLQLHRNAYESPRLI